MTHLLHTFLEQCLTMPPNPLLALHSAPAYEAYGGIAAYTDVIVYYQSADDHQEIRGILI